QVIARLRTAPSLSLRALVGTFERGQAREALIGSFCALLELVRLEVIDVQQKEQRGEIEIQLRAERAGDLDDLLRRTHFDQEEPANGANGAAGDVTPVQHDLGLEGEDDPSQ